MISMEFTTTATVRPEIIDKTYSSFCSNFIDVNFSQSTLYINIDPLPTSDYSSVIDVCKKYFGNIICNTPNEPNFSRALKWCWNQPKEKIFFHLEDDWILMKQIKMEDLIERLNNIISIASRMKIRNTSIDRHIGINLRAYSHINDRRVCLSPGLFLSEWAKKASNIFRTDCNPERQMRKGFGIGNHFLIASRALHYPPNRNEIIIEDIGRKWMSENSKYIKENGPAFNRWIERG